MRLWSFPLCLLLLLPASALAETQVSVAGLFNGKAMLVVNGGKPRTYSAGQVTPEGVKLVSADSSKAVVEVEGKRRELAMGQGISIAGSGGGAQMATLYANKEGHFFGDGSINGAPVKFLVDTGATSIALSSDEARRIGLVYINGNSGLAQTASGSVKAYQVTLNSLKIGGITMYQVDAVVLEGSSPPFVLLGMTALNRMDMQRNGIALTLTKKY